MSVTAGTVIVMDSLVVLKAIGDETRFAMYRILRTSTKPRSARELADALDIHPNTVRLHIERLSEAGLVVVHAVHRGTVGRPLNVYSVPANAPAIDFDPPAQVVLAGLLGSLAQRAGALGESAAETGRTWGRNAARRTKSTHCIEALTSQMSRLGFDIEAASDDGEHQGGESAPVRLSFSTCPFRELAEAFPDLVCNLHRGMCEGVVEESGAGRIETFSTLHEGDPCSMTVAVG